MASVDALVMGRKTFESVRDMEARHCRARHCRARQAAMACNGMHASSHFPEVLGEINSKVPHRNLEVNSQQLSVIDIIDITSTSACTTGTKAEFSTLHCRVGHGPTVTRQCGS